MAEIYSPWQFSGAESTLEEGLATKTYQDQADEVEDMLEGKMPEAEHGNGEHGGPMAEHMAAVLSTIQQQSDTIRKLTAMLSGADAGAGSE
jgi:hypothetical protein